MIDPRRTGVAERADMHVPLLPGTDAVLALAIAHELERRQILNTRFIAQHTKGADQFLHTAREWTLAAAALECGLDENIIVELVDLIAKSHPQCCAWGGESNEIVTVVAACWQYSDYGPLPDILANAEVGLWRVHLQLHKSR